MKVKLRIPEKLWSDRVNRMRKLCAMNAPVTVIAHEALLLLDGIGIFRAILMHFHSRYWSRISYARFIFWHQVILRKSPGEIDQLFFRTP